MVALENKCGFFNAFGGSNLRNWLKEKYVIRAAKKGVGKGLDGKREICSFITSSQYLFKVEQKLTWNIVKVILMLLTWFNGCNN